MLWGIILCHALRDACICRLSRGGYLSLCCTTEFTLTSLGPVMHGHDFRSYFVTQLFPREIEHSLKDFHSTYVTLLLKLPLF